MEGDSRVVACTKCGAGIPLRAAYPGVYSARCGSCRGQSRFYFPPPKAAAEGPGAPQFVRLAKFRAIRPFDVVYQRFESTAEHVLPGKWGLLAVYVGCTLLAEIVVATLHQPLWGLVLHAIVLVTLLAQGAAIAVRSEPTARAVLALTLLPLIRIVSLTTPLGAFSYLQWFVVIGAILYAAVFALLRVLETKPHEVGLALPDARSFPLEAGVVLLGVGLGLAEYALLRPGPLVDATSLGLLVGPALLLVVFSGLLEELVFRGVLPRFLAPVYGAPAAILLPATVQAVLAVGFLEPMLVPLVFASGVAFGWVARRTGSVLGVGVAHGVANALLFLALPVTGLPF